jgi:phosphopantothenoylcysteine decarboxylase
MQDKEILVGVCGGVAAYKVADLVSKLVQQRAKVTVVMTPAAEKFIGRTTFEALTGRAVRVDGFEPVDHFIGEHIGLGRAADLYIIAPATADMLAKLAHGHSNDLVSLCAQTVTCPVLVAPAMNNEMWVKPAVQRNVVQLREDGYKIVGPKDGWLSCGAIGPGRMAEPAEILLEAAALLK